MRRAKDAHGHSFERVKEVVLDFQRVFHNQLLGVANFVFRKVEIRPQVKASVFAIGLNV